MKTKIKGLLILLGAIGLIIGTISNISEISSFPVPSPSNYTGYVRDTDGQGISNAYVKLYVNGVLRSTDYTSSSGYYSLIRPLVSGTFKIVAIKTGYQTQTKTVSSYGGTYNFYLKGYWALVIEGQLDDDSTYYGERFTRDAFGMYNTLIDHYGFTSSNVYLLTAATSVDGTSIPRDRATSETNIDWAFTELTNKVCSGDQVVIYWTGHGLVDQLVMETFTITANDFDTYLDAINCKELIVFLGQCYSGSFINNLNDEHNRVIYTSCSSSEMGLVYIPPSGIGDPTHSLFPWAIYRGLDFDMYAKTADTNWNQKVSMTELFTYSVNFIQDCLASVSASQHPQSWIGNNIDASNLYIGSKNTIPPIVIK